MKTIQKIHLNLAGNPLRNKRPFYFTLSGLVMFCLAVFFVAGSITLRTGRRIREYRTSIAGTEMRINEVEREEKRLDANVTKAEKEMGESVTMLNSIIYLKTFSWTEFFSRLEKGLPASSYITTLNPKFHPDALLEIELNVMTPGLDELLLLLQNLKNEGFSRIRLIRESWNESGLMAHIVLSLEDGKTK
ncbi:MAG: hypothetical protein JXB26_12540 [Candidatus Aminicenantes bacterium]|nr:hypothetical protein [Candidatus Aminicenantes bacterium]